MNPARLLLSSMVGLCLFLGTASGEKLPERHYQRLIAEKLGGKMEARVENGRVDVLTKTHAIEVEFASRWKNAIGQALWYALQTNKEAGIVLIVVDPVKDRPNVIRLGSLIQKNNLPIKLWLWPDDFIAGPKL